MREFLLIEDNQDTAELFEYAARQLNIIPTVCDDGAAALKLLEAKEFDVVILDLSMPVLDGLTISQQIRKNEEIHPNKKPVCIIFYTARNIDRAILRVAHEVNVMRIYQKPYDMTDMLAEIYEICGEPPMVIRTQEKRQNGKANYTIPVAVIGIFALILTIGYFNRQMTVQDRDFDLTLKSEREQFALALHAEQEKWAKDWSLMKSQRDQIKANCDSILEKKDGQEIFAAQEGLQMPAELLSEKPCNYTE